MKKFDINPLILLIAAMVIFLISIISLNSKQVEKNKSEYNFTKNKEIINSYSNMNNNWANLKVQENIINKLLKTLKIKNASLKIKNAKIVVNIKANKNILNRFINKLLNEKLSLIKLKLSKEKLSFEVGII